ncbi:MAG: DUF3352 domain-containing protein [Oscillochloridaceae bacterium umkhey_bin13]
MSAHSLPQPAQRERGLGYFLLGGLGITLIAMVIGGGFFAIILFASRGPAAAELLRADTQLYAALAPNVGGVVEVSQLQRALREGLGVTDPAPLLPAIEALLGVSLGDGNLGTWLGSEMIVAVRGFPGSTGSGPEAAATLLREGEVVFLLGSKNDPQASGFLAKHYEARLARGETLNRETLGEVQLYYQVDGPPSPITAFALINHYVVFSNSPEALRAMATLTPGTSEALATAPGFAVFEETLLRQRNGAVFTDGSAQAESARAALREVLMGLMP